MRQSFSSLRQRARGQAGVILVKMLFLDGLARRLALPDTLYIPSMSLGRAKPQAEPLPQGCAPNVEPCARRLGEDFDVGFPIDSKVIQPNLDFGIRKKDLFSGKEMGEDVHRALDNYLRLLSKIMARVDQERPVLDQAIQWANEILGCAALPCFLHSSVKPCLSSFGLG